MRNVRTPATALALLLAMAATGSAQSLEEKLQAKLKDPFVANDGKKVIFGYFTRSYQP
jgi:hypothetical protein